MAPRHHESLYLRARTPPSAHPAPNNVGVVLLVMVLLGVVAALVFVVPEIVGEIRRMTYCWQNPHEAVC